MILQNLQYPEAGDNERGMYYWFSDEKCYVTADKMRLTVDRGCTVHFNTYFNSFSYGKWKKYTKLDRLMLKLNLKGSFEVLLIRNDAAGEAFEEYVLHRQKVESNELREFVFAYPATAEKGIVGFKIVAFEDGEIQGGCYTNPDENSIDEVNLALCVCTYKRENYVTSNMEMLKNNVFSDENSMLNRRLRVYIADNGRTLDPDMFGTEQIKIYPNMNTGGAGGFSRAIIEAAAEREKHGLTHIILMDDDVVFSHHALERTYMFLKLLKDEHRNIMLGGAMLKLDLPFAQFAAGETWSVKEIIFNKVNYNLYELKYILRNEIEEDVNQLAWWFCCFPMDDNSKNNLALPIFFQYDDIDFNQRNSHLHKVTLNGVCLWHEAFEKKINVSKEYYAMRNRLIVSSIHGGNEFTKKFVKKLVGTTVIKNLMMYRYRAADLLLRAVEDFVRGFEWLVSVNPEELNGEIMEMGYKLQPLDELSVSFIYSKYAESLMYNEGKIKRLLRLLTFNGYLLKSRGADTIVSAGSEIKGNYFRARRVLNYDENSLRGFVVEKSYTEVCRIWSRLRRVMRLLDRRFAKSVEAYRRDWPMFASFDFWSGFLMLE